MHSKSKQGSPHSNFDFQTPSTQLIEIKVKSDFHRVPNMNDLILTKSTYILITQLFIYHSLIDLVNIIK